MTERTHHIVAAYDIHDPRRLARVAKISKNFGERVLMSVFEFSLVQSEFDRLKERIDAEIDHMEDSVRFYFVCEKCRRLADSSGAGGRFFVEEDVFIG